MQAHISISIQEGKIDISGPEEFVQKQIDNFKTLIQKLLTLPPKPPDGAIRGASAGADSPGVHKGTGWDKVIAFDDDKIKVLKTPPGAKKREKTINMALIYLHAKGIKGEESATSEEIRSACKDHGCLDIANFAKTLKTQKENLLVSGSARSKNQSFKLTVPGKDKAAGLVAELNAQ